jgi:hypothetical protein
MKNLLQAKQDRESPSLRTLVGPARRAGTLRLFKD